MTIDPIELAAAVISLLSIYLATVANIWYYPTGIAGLLLYTWTFFHARLYAETGLQIVCLGLMIYGWYEWLHGGEQRRELPIARTPRWAWVSGISAGLAMWIVFVVLQRRYTDNPAPLVDSSIAAWSLVAQWMTARKWLENWILWVLINTVSIPLYISRELWFTAALYVGLWILAIFGYREWRRALVSA